MIDVYMLGASLVALQDKQTWWDENAVRFDRSGPSRWRRFLTWTGAWLTVIRDALQAPGEGRDRLGDWRSRPQVDRC